MIPAHATPIRWAMHRLFIVLHVSSVPGCLRGELPLAEARGRVVYEGQPVASGFSTFLPIAETVRPQDRSAGRGAFPCGLPFCVDTFADLSMGPSSVNIASKRRLPSPETKTS
jgi:hypothetical protein